jgi:hypothetical protein
MSLFGKLPQDITEADLQALIGTDEDQTTDFKIAAYPPYAPPKENEYKKEFCADLSAFANAKGGWIVCGMDEKDGTATALNGLTLSNFEKEIARLQQIADSGIEPRIPGLYIRAVDLQSGLKAIVIYIPQSFAAPHRVKETSKFWLRRSNNKLEMNVDELRTAFSTSNAFVNQIREFRKQRVQFIHERSDAEVPIPLASPHVLIIHVTSLSFGVSTNYFSQSGFRGLPSQMLGYFPYGEGKFNFDGYVHAIGNRGDYDSYIQVFRNGAIEYVSVLNDISKQNSPRKVFALRAIERTSIDALQKFVKIFAFLGIVPPIDVMLSLSGINECILIPSTNIVHVAYSRSVAPIKQHKMMLPDVVLENSEQDTAHLLRSTFDVLYNAAGYVRSLSYDEQGNWKEQAASEW